MLKIMKKGLRGLLRKISNPLSERGGDNIGIVRRPLQPTHGKPESVSTPKQGPIKLPVTKASKNNLSARKGVAAGNIRSGRSIKQTGTKAEMAGDNTGKIKWTDRSDDRYDQAHGIKEGSKQDRALDAKRGVKENDAPKKKTRLSAIAKETRAIKARMKKRSPYA